MSRACSSLRREQREDALAFYDRILRQIDSNDAVVRLDTARALSEASVLQHQLGHTDEAEKSVRRALTLMAGLRSERRDDLESLVCQVECLLRLGTYLSTLKTRDQSISVGRESVELAERVAQAAPDDLAHQELLAICHQDLGNALFRMEQRQEAKVHYRKAIEIRERIDPSKLPGVTQRLAQTLMNEGVVLWGEKSHSPAEERFHQAEKKLLSLPPDQLDPDGNTDVALGLLYMNWGGMLFMLGRFDEAIARADAGIKRVEACLQTEPNDASVRRTCLELHGNRGYALLGLGRHQESAKEWTRVVELSDPPVPAEYRIRLAIELVSAGEVGQALAQAQVVQPAPGISGVDCYNLGCLFSLCARAVRKDTGRSPDQRANLAESHIAEAIRWLKAAGEAGFFRDPANRELAKKDSDLEILRDRPEFRQLVEPSTAKP